MSLFTRQFHAAIVRTTNDGVVGIDGTGGSRSGAGKTAGRNMILLDQGLLYRERAAAGIPVALGSDGPMNPYLNIMLASIDPDRPAEAITREEAVIAYTLTAAYAEFAEKDKGSLELNKLADLAVISQDIFTVPPPELPKTESVLTLVNGKIIYDAKVVATQ